MRGLRLGLGLRRPSTSAPVELAPAPNGGGWTFQTGWSAVDATTMQASSAAANTKATVTSVTTGGAGEVYKIVYTVTLTAGNVSGLAGFVTGGTARTSSGTYTDTITTTGAGPVGFQARSLGFTGTISNVSITKIG